MPYIVTAECLNCGACIAGCENDAITEGDFQSHIDPELCIECGTCEMNCPVSAIIYVDDEEYERMITSQKEVGS
jgi:ferredoxin